MIGALNRLLTTWERIVQARAGETHGAAETVMAYQECIRDLRAVLDGRLGNVFSKVNPIMPDDDVATVIAKLRMSVQVLEDRLDQTKKWGEAMSKRWGIVHNALEASLKVQQEL